MKLPNPKLRDRRGGWALIVIGVLVLVFAGTIGYQLVQCVHHVLPPTCNGQPVTTNTIVVWSGTNNANQHPQEALQFNPAPTFTLEYGLATDLRPWALDGSPLPPSPQAGQITSIITDEDALCVFTFAAVGNTIRYSSWDGGDLVEVIDLPHTLVVERTTNFVDWQAVWTNSCVATNTVELWTDEAAPGDRAFYRVRE